MGKTRSYEARCMMRPPVYRGRRCPLLTVGYVDVVNTRRWNESTDTSAVIRSCPPSDTGPPPAVGVPGESRSVARWLPTGHTGRPVGTVPEDHKFLRRCCRC